MITIVTLALSGFKQREKTNVNAIKIQKKHNATNRLKLVKYKQFEKILKDIDTPFKSDIKLESKLSKFISKLKESNPEGCSKVLKMI